MNINELRELVKHCVYIEKGITCMSDTYYDDMIRTINNLQSKIDKAIEYIEDNKQYAELEDYGKNGNDYVDADGVLDILKI